MEFKRCLLQLLVVALAFVCGISFATRFIVVAPIVSSSLDSPDHYTTVSANDPNHQHVVSSVSERVVMTRPPRLANTILAFSSQTRDRPLRYGSSSLIQTQVNACDPFPPIDTSGFGSVVVEVGTNISPETAKMSSYSPNLETAPSQSPARSTRDDAAGGVKMSIEVDDLLAATTSDDDAVNKGNSSTAADLAPPNKATATARSSMKVVGLDAASRPTREQRFFITVDPLPDATDASLRLRKVHRVLEGAVVPVCGEVSFFVDRALSGVYANAASKTAPKTVVGAFPLSSLLRSLEPPSQRVQLLMVDAQGFDQSVVLSGGGELERVDNVILECQDLNATDPRLLSPLAGNCANASLALQSIGFRFGFCLRNMGPSELNCWFYHPRFVVYGARVTMPVAQTVRPGGINEIPAALLPLVGDLFKVMCPSFVIGHLYAVACKLPTVLWTDPAAIRAPAPMSERCLAFEQMYVATPEGKRRGRQNHAQLIACATGKSLEEALVEVKNHSPVTAPGYRKKRIQVRRKERV